MNWGKGMKRTFFVHNFCFDVLPRWLRRKLKKLRSGFVQIPRRVTRVALVSVVLAAAFLVGDTPEALAQTDIGNHREWTGWTGLPQIQKIMINMLNTL